MSCRTEPYYACAQVNKAIHAAAGPELARLCVEQHKTARVGHAYPVELPATNDLRLSTKIRWVINVLGMHGLLLGVVQRLQRRFCFLVVPRSRALHELHSSGMPQVSPRPCCKAATQVL